MRIFWKNPAPSLFRIHRPLTTCQVSDKSNDQIPRKVCYGRTDERTNERTGLNLQNPFRRSAGGPNKIFSWYFLNKTASYINGCKTLTIQKTSFHVYFDDIYEYKKQVNAVIFTIPVAWPLFCNYLIYGPDEKIVISCQSNVKSIVDTFFGYLLPVYTILTIQSRLR